MAEQTGKSGVSRILDKGRTVVYDGKSTEGKRGARRQLTDANEFFTHFNTGATIPPGVTKTDEGTPVAAITYGTGLGGTAVATSDDVAAASIHLDSTSLIWQADRQTAGQPLVFETKVKFGTLTAREFWFGISDANNDTAIYALSLTSTFTTSVPTDAAVVGYSATPTSGAAFTSGGNQHVALATKADVDAIVATGCGAVATATYYTYRVEVDADGNAAYFVDGKFLGKKTGALTKTVPLGFVCYAIPRTTAGSSEAVMTIDYIYMGGK